MRLVEKCIRFDILKNRNIDLKVINISRCVLSASSAQHRNGDRFAWRKVLLIDNCRSSFCFRFLFVRFASDNFASFLTVRRRSNQSETVGAHFFKLAIRVSR